MIDSSGSQGAKPRPREARCTPHRDTVGQRQLSPINYLTNTRAVPVEGNGEH